MRVSKSLFKIITVGLLGASLFLIACGEEEEEEEELTTDPLNSVPQVQVINISGIGTSDSASLTADTDCDAASNQGIFGLAFGAACHSAPFAENLLLGENGGDPGGDGEVNCSDYVSDDDDSGILMSLLCESWIQSNPNLVSVGFEESGSAIAISFEDFDSTDIYEASGAWTAGSDSSYPANIRMWTGTGLSDLSGVVGIALADLNNGRVFFDSAPFAASGETAVQAQVDFSAKDDVSSCVDTPNETNCHWQELSMYAGEEVVSNGPPNGFHIKIFANDIDSPTFMALEGRFRYVDGSGFGDDLSAVRQIYFQVVEEDDIVWGTFSFLDEDGELVSTSNSFLNTFLSTLANDGICSDDLVGDATNFGASKTCTDLGVDSTKWSELFSGLASFGNVTESPIPDIFSSGAPASAGINTQ